MFHTAPHKLQSHFCERVQEPASGGGAVGRSLWRSAAWRQIAKSAVRWITLATVCGLVAGMPPEIAAAGRSAPPRKVAVTPRRGRDTRVIDDGWTFKTDPGNTGEASGWAKSPPPEAKPISIPSLWTTSAAPNYSGAAWYWRIIEPPAAWKGQTVRVRFEAASERATVWCNGQRLGEHRGGATPFDFNATTQLKVGARNTLAVRLEGRADRSAGIWQNVVLMAHDEAFIVDIFPDGGPLGNLRADVEINNTSDKSGDAELDARVAAVDAPTVAIKSSGQNLSLTPSRNVTTMVVNVPVKRLTPWAPDFPTLYRLELVFHQDKDVLDTDETVFGFRELGWKNDTITVNGTEFVPSASAMVGAHALVTSGAPEREAVRGLLRKLKASRFNVVYVAAPQPAVLAISDQEGIMVVEGPRPESQGTEAVQELEDLVRRDRSHPSILAWNLGNLGDIAAAAVRRLDSTRFMVIRSADGARLVPPRSEDMKPVPAPTGLIPR